MKCFPLFISDT